MTFHNKSSYERGFPGGTSYLPMQEIEEMWVQFLGGEDPLEEEMVTHSSILAWKSSHGQWILEGLQSTGSQRHYGQFGKQTLGVWASLEAKTVKNLPAMQEIQL